MLALLRRPFRVIARWRALVADDRFAELTAENAGLRHDLAEERSRVRILLLEQDNLLSVIERDRKRIQAETQNFASAFVEAERKARGGA